jgi:hypothetical protein
MEEEMKEMVRREFRLVLALSDYSMKIRKHHDTESKLSGIASLYIPQILNILIYLLRTLLNFLL